MLLSFIVDYLPHPDIPLHTILVLRLMRWQNTKIHMLREVLTGLVHLRIIAMRFGYPHFKVVTDQVFCNSTKKAQSSLMASDEIGKALGPYKFSVKIRAEWQSRNHQLCSLFSCHYGEQASPEQNFRREIMFIKSLKKHSLGVWVKSDM